MARKTLVTGGAGYIGSHATLALLQTGQDVVVLDNLSSGNKLLVPSGTLFIEGDAGDQDLVRKIIRQHDIHAMMHFAGSIIVEESMTEPLKYYRNNTFVSLNLIEACVEEKVNNFIFSSTAAVYGNPDKVPVAEDAVKAPINPYGESKAITETILRDVNSACPDFNYIALRYFNVSGADPDGRAGQMTRQSTHLIKVACELAAGKRESMTVFGTDYDTRDGTCIRDFIHVSDLADVHVKALQYLVNNRECRIINCGYGQGYSVRETLDALQSIVRRPLNITDGGRRAGDPAMLISDNSLLKSLIDWTPKYNDIKMILSHALAWEERLSELHKS
jgi:UDP-glucose 4-epimerase